MRIVQTSPLIIRLYPDSQELNHLNKVLSYKNTSADYNYRKAKNNSWAARQNPNYLEYLLDLKSKIDQSLLFEDDDGYYTYSGLIDYLKKEFSSFFGFVVEFENQVQYPEFELMPWDLNYKPATLRPYQEEMLKTCLDNPHCAISAATGSGKTLTFINLIKEAGLPALIVAPSVSIAEQIYNACLSAFGKKYVGMYGNGKKEFKKRIVIGIAAGISKLKEKDEAYKALSHKKVLCFDESHRLGADFISKVMTKVGANIPYRWSFSATQIRGDGAGLFLDSLIGPIKYRKNYDSLVQEGFLAKLNFNIFSVKSTSEYDSKTNSKRMAQEHLLYNPNIIRLVTFIANAKAAKGEPTVILIDEFEQEVYIRNYLKYNYLFANSQTDVTAVVKDFIDGKAPILIGTSSIATGTDIKNVKNLILFIYGSSPIVIKQAIGRGTRLAQGKTECNVYDFLVENVPVCEHHFKNRLFMYREMSDNIKIIES